MKLAHAAFCTVLLTACAPSSPGEPWARSDSAGVEIVTSDPDAPRWTGVLEPLLSLGTIGGGGVTEFYRVRDVEFLESGTFAVADAGNEEVRVFARDGRFVRRFGRPGRGPREFTGLDMVRVYGDSILTYDGGNDRIGIRDSLGALGRAFKLEWFGGFVFPVDVAPSGEVLAVTARPMTELRGTGAVVDTALVSLYDLDGRLLDSVARLPHNTRFVRQVGERRITVGAPFTASASLVSIDAGFCYTFGPAAEVRCYGADDGALSQIARVRAVPRTVQEADVQRYWDELLAGDETAFQRTVLRLRDDLAFPKTFPAISALATDDAGRVWARRYRAWEGEGDRWWVFEDGALAGDVASPEGFEILDVAGDLVGGVWRDEFDVEYVRVYRLVESPGRGAR